MIRSWTTCCVAIGAFCRAVLFAAPLPDPVPPLTNIASVLQLSAERAAAELPVRVRAAVTFADGPAGMLFVEDETGGIFVGTRHALPSLPRGTLLDIDGRSDAGLHLPAISRASIQAAGQTRQLIPARPALSQIVSGEYDCRFVELQGVVRSVEEDRGKAILLIESATGETIEARFSRLNRSRLWDARVRVRGVCGLRGMNDRRVISIILYCSGDDAITVEKAGLADAFAAPLRKLDAIGAGDRRGRIRMDTRVVRISGTAVTLEDASGETTIVQANAQSLLHAGDRVQLSVVPDWTNGNPGFRYVQLRAVAPTQPAADSIGPRPLAPIMTRVSDVRRLGEKAGAGWPVRIRGVVTFYDRAWKLFVQDDSGGIYVYPAKEKFSIAPGQLVEVEGFTDSGMYAPVISNPRFTVIEAQASLPQPKVLLPDVLLRGQHDSLRVEVAGVVSSISSSEDNTAQLDLVTSAGRIATFLLVTNSILPTNLVNAEVRVRGVCGSSFNNRRQFTGAQLHVASAGDIVVDRAAPVDPFFISGQPIASLMQFGSGSMHRLKVGGTVTFVDRRKSIVCVQDASGGVVVHLQEWKDVQPGQSVDVVGFPVTAEYTPQLIEGTIRPSQEVRALAPLEINADADRFGKHDSELVSVTARLLDRFTRGSNDVLVLQAGDFSFEAEKPHDEATSGWFSTLAPQSMLEVTGVCIVLVNQASTPRHFKLLLRGPSDVVVLSTPSIWADERFRFVAAGAVLLVITPVIWVALLRRKVRQQTAIIRAQLAREQLYNEELELKVHDRTRALSDLNEELCRARDELESRVEKRTAELSHANRALREEVAERQRSEQALRISEERFSKAFRCSPVPMGISDAEKGVFLDVNEALARALDCGREEVLERASAEINVWANPDDRLRALEMLRTEEPVRNWQVELRTVNGEERHALVSMEKIIVKDVPCLLILFNDVTERVRLEAQFRHSQKMEAVGQLAAGIAHDFNNILTVIQGHVGLLLATIQNQEHAGSLNEVSRAADRASDLTRQLLTFSRRQPLLSRTLDLNQVISSTSQMLRRILSEQISLSFRHAPSLPAIHADQGMIEQIILNLAVNARDAMPNGGRFEFATSVRTTSEDHLRRNPDAVAGEFVCMNVADTGCGMDAATLSRIFEPFFTTKEVGKGTGLGLATVYGIVKQHGGWIEVASEVNRGTQFTIYFPARREGSGAARGLSSEAPVRGGTETILLVEDEPGVRELARNVLRRYGYTVVCAANGIEALEAWKRSAARIDLLLTDMVMPEGLSGHQLAARLCLEDPGLKILFTSGYSVDLEEGGVPLKVGVNFLPKPYPARQLAAHVRRCLDCDCLQEAPA